jgi:hypothetical protein
MSVLQAADIADLLASTLENLGRMKLTDIMSTYQNTIFLKRMVKKGKMTFDGGDKCTFNTIYGTNGSARGVGLYYTANVNPTNVLARGEMDWRHVTWNWAIERREIAMNSGSANKIVDLIKTRRWAALGDAVLHFERRGWRLAATTDEVNFQGIPYWVTMSSTATTTNDGFNGSVPSGYTTVGGIDPTTAGITPKWNNYAAPYTNITKEDFVTELERASDYTDFMPLVEEIPTYNTGDDYGYYTTYAIRQDLKRILEAQNESLGFDLDPVNGKLVFRRTPVAWVKELDASTSGVFYGINWGVFKVKGLRGEWMNETHKASHDSQPTVAATHTDCTLNTYCTDRRRNFVLSTGTTELT